LKKADLEQLARELRSGATPPGVEVLKRNAARIAVRVEDVLLKVYLARPDTAVREANALTRAHERELSVPELVAFGRDWTATRWLADARPAGRGDLPVLLRDVAAVHTKGMLHGDLHVGNLLVRDGRTVLLDLQRARFWPWLPGFLRRRDLGYLAFSLGEPLPAELANARFWAGRRARTHWRSRTRRCLEESSGFSALALGAGRGFRRRDADPRRLAETLGELAHTRPFKVGSGASLYRIDAWIVKRFASAADAKRAWLGGSGLEARGFATCRALAWLGHELVMEDCGATLSDWVESEFARAPEPARAELADTLGSLLAALHRRGVYHADLKANNVVWRPGEPARLLDYGRVRFSARVTRRRRVKNLAQLNAALPDVVPGALRDAALTRYLAESGYADDPALLRRDVIAESLRRSHRWSGRGC
jgi:tRNA A-37 threonylcarbamoyl transferase component Bud32